MRWSPGELGRLTPSRAVALASVPLAVVYFLVGNDGQTAIYQVFSAGALVAVIVGIRRHRPRHARAWWLFAAALALWCAGDAYWDCYRWVLQAQAPYPSFADLAYWLGYPFFIAGVLALMRDWGRPRLADVLDGTIVAVAGGFLSFQLLLAPIAGSSPIWNVGTMVALGGPTADIVLLAGMTQLVFRRREPNVALHCIIGAIAATLFADGVYGYLNLRGTYTTGNPIDLGWLVFYTLWAVAALHPSMTQTASLRERLTPQLSHWRVGALLTSLLIVPVSEIVEALMGDPVNDYVFGAVMILSTVLVGARVFLLQRQRDEAQSELARQNEQLRELDALKDNLIALVSHELRTPLTSIVGYLELVSEEPSAVREAERGYLDVVDRNAKRLLRLVSDLLFVAQLQAGRLSLAHETVSLSEVVDDAVAVARPIADERAIAVDAQADADLEVVGDRQRLGQVLDNVLSNALKFTPPGGSVSVNLRRDGEQALLEVADTGMGIPEAEQDRLFTRFYRTENAMAKAIQGTGLGLSIAQAIVEGHGGGITFESVEGVGTTFRIALPAALAARAAA